MKKQRPQIKSKALRKAYDRYIGSDLKQQAAFDEELANSEIALKIYETRTKAGLTQRALAKLVGTTASVICQLEDSDYQGHSLSMLRRIALALHQRVQIRFIPVGKSRKTA
ncbi:MAG: XRE family transcriptional regulator [Planctomycetota bacterium]